MAQHDPVEDLLRPLPLSDRVKAAIWDMVEDAIDRDDLADRLVDVPLSDDVKTQLLVLKTPTASADQTPTEDFTADDLTRLLGLTDLSDVAGLLPFVGGGVGGLMGGPLGAAAGGIIGEAGRQLVTPPATRAERVRGLLTAGATQGVTELAGPALKAVGALGRATFRGYLKPRLTALLAPRAAEIVETAIREGIAVTRGGAEKAQGLIDGLNAKVERIITSTPGDVDLGEIATKLRQWARTTYFQPGAPTADYKAVLRVANEIDQHPSLPVVAGAPVTTISVPAAQQVKRRLQRSAGETAYGIERAATIEARKHGGFLAREAIEARAPAVGPVNLRESKLIDVKQAVDAAVNREANRNPWLQLPTAVSVGIGGLEGARQQDPVRGLTTAIALRVGLTPGVATRAAIYAARLGTIPGTLPANAIRLGILLATEEDIETAP